MINVFNHFPKLSVETTPENQRMLVNWFPSPALQQTQCVANPLGTPNTGSSGTKNNNRVSRYTPIASASLPPRWRVWFAEDIWPDNTSAKVPTALSLSFEGLFQHRGLFFSICTRKRTVCCFPPPF